MASDLRNILIGADPLGIEQIDELAKGRARMELASEGTFIDKMESGVRLLSDRTRREQKVYGVNTGFGESCINRVDSKWSETMPLNLMRFHGCGTGHLFSDHESLAIIGTRAASLVSGWSAIRPQLVRRLCDMVNYRVLPQIPQEGSVGASGDLTPMSYVAAALCGEREVKFRGCVMPASNAWQTLGMQPFVLAQKESLAIMNGTTVMTALVCLGFVRAQRLLRWSASLSAMASDVLKGNPGHFDARIFEAKPHPGQQLFATWIREDIEYAPGAGRVGRIQDRYSIRCAPHVGGVLLDALMWMRPWVETELNGANDNPLVDPQTGEVLHGGNFYGGHVCFVADGIKNAVANLADLLDRQLALLCSRESNAGLPENLVGRKSVDRASHHGFKAMQIATSALTAEALKIAAPASVFSRSTECHNQDKVSMGTIAARECLRVLELTETVASICTLALCQAFDLREGEGCHCRAQMIHEVVRKHIPPVDADRRQDLDIAQILQMHARGELPIGEVVVV